MNKIIINRAACLKCGEIIESTFRWDFRACGCGAIAVDGGNDYLRRVGSLENCLELSEYKDE